MWILRVSECDIGRWGLNCTNACDKACPDCDHRTGCCKTSGTGLSIFCGIGTGRLPARQTVAVAIEEGDGSNGTVRKTNDGRNDTTRKTDDGRNGAVRKTDEEVADRSNSARFRMLSTTIRLQTATWEPTAVDEENGTNIESGTVDGGKPAVAANPRNRSAATESTWTPLEATALKYDELVMKLVWIFSMTVVAIAMVFVIMFVVFFNCYGTSKPENANTAAGRNPWPQQSTDKIRGTTVKSYSSDTPVLHTTSTLLL